MNPASPMSPRSPITRAGRRARPAARGFTLVEVLVALAIIAIALGAALRAAGAVSANEAALRARLLASYSADNRLTELRLARAWLPVGRTQFDCPQGPLELVCHQTVSETANPLFRKVEVSVTSAQTGATLLADLIMVLPNEVTRPL
ncbi:type II secretion system minor pseudopilin GspI [Chitinasiproducens palmae]|uniref:Type II secretion system protein I n=1 Tax=Chitinasiproducens palmae TaxID=1770053 RepID=A0A1H2PP34_9BURK|nr:type II secretion system minor pseudopilin GspI [Chitinasiproducens palmae]SDV48486.1 type II secretion system protein I (GspI) [Chitinasiproducens palmae]